jgi:hypothetical protein
MTQKLAPAMAQRFVREAMHGDEVATAATASRHRHSRSPMRAKS